MTRHVASTLVGISSIALALGLTAPLDAQAAAPNPGAASGIAEIVVTAQRRAEPLQRTPVAVTALDANALKAKNITSLSDISRVAPNVAISSSSYNAPTNALPIIYIRGIGQQDPSIYSDPGVPVYVDGVYVARSAGGAIDLPDLGQVEVLRGPQGTLFGKNAVGGAVNITTRQPGAHPGTDVEISGGNYGRLEARAVSDVAVSDRFAFTAALDLKRENGFGDRLAVGTNDKLGSLGRQRHISARLHARWTPTDRLTIDLSGDYTRYHDTATPSQGVIIDSGLKNTYNALVGSHTGMPIVQATAASGRYDDYSLNPQPARDELGGGSATIAYDLGGATLKSITAYRKAHDQFSRDADASPAVYLEPSRQMHSRQFTEELQLLGKAWGDRIDYIVGGFYLHDRSRQFDSVALLPDLYLVTHNPGLDLSRDYHDHQTTNSYAAYAQATLHITHRLGLTAGLRYTDEKKSAVVLADSPISGIVYVPTTNLSDRWHATTPHFALNYQLSDRVMAYFSASKGFKSGGFNGRPSNLASLTLFDPEKVWSYEVGLKSEFLDRHVRANFALYRMDYDNIQLSRQTIINNILISDISNVASARIQGAEAELTLIPFRNFEIDAAGGYTHNEYREVQPGAAVNADSKIPYAPKWTASLSASYKIDTGAGTVTPSMTYSYRSHTFTTPNNSAVSRLPGYGLLSARIGFTPRDSRWDLSLFGTNLTNKRYLVSIGDSTGIGLIYNLYGRPREFGGTAGLHF